ncbi:hypothetical protein CRU92_07410 [Arcobacter sp. FW59]|nr:hypothetical protein CRU92_07410 [Arcobacter sp. FW59]
MEILNNTSSIISNTNSENISSEIVEKKDSFDIFMENREKEKSKQKETEELLEDLDFVAKTGFTKEQLEAIRQKLEELQKARVESGHTPKNIEEVLANQKADLQAAIYEVTGKNVNLDEETISNFMKEQNGNEFKSISTDESLRLLAEFKNK